MASLPPPLSLPLPLSVLAAFYTRNFAEKMPDIKPPLLQVIFNVDGMFQMGFLTSCMNSIVIYFISTHIVCNGVSTTRILDLWNLGQFLRLRG